MPRSKKTQFQFVNIENPEQSAQAETRQLVRRHVMQNHLRQRLEDQARSAVSSRDEETASASSPVTSPASVAAPTLMCNCFGTVEETAAASQRQGTTLTIETCPMCGRLFLKALGTGLQTPPTRPRSPAKEIVLLGSGRADPFNSYAIEMSPYMHGLMDHSEQIRAWHNPLDQY